MSLLLIQGQHIARYVGREQREVVRVDSWEQEYDYRAFIEELRMNGLPDDIQTQQG